MTKNRMYPLGMKMQICHGLIDKMPQVQMKLGYGILSMATYSIKF